MSSEPYVPDWTDLRDRYAFHASMYTGATIEEARREAERGIEKIKADARIAAWKEAAEFMRSQVSDDVVVLRAAHLASATLYYRASQIEEEA